MSKASAQNQVDPARSAPTPAVVLPLESAARIQLDRAISLARSQSWEESLEAYRRVANQFGDRLVEWPQTSAERPRDFTRYLPVREFVWREMARLKQSAPDVLAAYRRQVDPQARRWLEDRSDDAGAARIVDDLFLSSLGDDALLRLGDTALERGHHSATRRYLERIAPSLRFPRNDHPQLRNASGRPLWLPFRGTEVDDSWKLVAEIFNAETSSADLAYPDTDIQLAQVRARLILASILEGNFDRASIEIQLLRRNAPEAVGKLSAREGNLADLCDRLLVEARNWQDPKPPRGWPTFSGNSARQHIASPTGSPASKPRWSVPLPRLTAPSELASINRTRVGEDGSGLLSYFPLVIGDLAVVQTGYARDQVQGYRLNDGSPVLPSGDESGPAVTSLSRRGYFGVPRFVPESHGRQLFLVSGFPWLTLANERESALVEAIDLAAERKLLWQFSPTAAPWGAGLTIAGSPVAHDSRLFVPLRRREPVRDEMQIAALDLRDGTLLWRQVIGTSEPASDPTWSELTNDLLTAQDDTVYWNTNAGLIAALDTRSGRIRWVTSYPRTGWGNADPDRNALHFYRNLNPCVVYQGVVIAAPRDCDRIFALDANTGRVLWATPEELAADAIHLLGVSAGRLTVSGECIYWFDVWNGELQGRFPAPFKAAQGFARPDPRGYGRGVLAGNHVYWPTRNQILVFDQSAAATGGLNLPDPTRTIDLAVHNQTGGNLTLSDESLLIAGADHLTAWNISQVEEAKPLSDTRPPLDD